MQRSLKDIAKNIAPQVRGWLNYYSMVGKTEIGRVMSYLNDKLVKFVKRKYKRFAGNRGKLVKARIWLSKVATADRNLFVHWTYGYIPYIEVN